MPLTSLLKRRGLLGIQVIELVMEIEVSGHWFEWILLAFRGESNSLKIKMLSRRKRWLILESI